MNHEMCRSIPCYLYNHGYYCPINSRGQFRQSPFPGTIQPYPGGYIIRSPIERKYLELIRQGFVGTPIIPESRTPDRVGLYRHYRNGGGEWSIYWSPKTGAHEIHGKIRDDWARWGWEKSFLGYPASDELMKSDGMRTQYFENGYIVLYPSGSGYIVEY